MTRGEGGAPLAVSQAIAALWAPPAGVAAFADVVFTGSPFEGRVIALARSTGAVVGELPAPEGGWLLPFMMHATGERRITVLDAGGMPSPDPFVPASPRLHEFDFTYGTADGLSATLVRTVDFAAVPVAFAEDFARLEDGTYLLSDAIYGAIWVARPDGSIQPGIVPEAFDFTAPIPVLAMCPTMPLIEVAGVPFLFSGSTLPGVSPLAVRDGLLYFYSPCAEGLYAVPVASLFDGRAPHARAADVRLVSAKPREIAVEQLLGLAFDPSDPADRGLYAADSLQLRVVRVDVDTGSRSVIAADPALFNFPSSTGFAPAPGGGSVLFVASNQQHLLTVTNDAADEDAVQLPFLLTRVLLPGQGSSRR